MKEEEGKGGAFEKEKKECEGRETKEEGEKGEGGSGPNDVRTARAFVPVTPPR